MARYAVTTPIELKDLCIKNNWFTAGTCFQYLKLFELNNKPTNVKDIALVIWLCSHEEDIEVIHNKLLEAKDQYHERIGGGTDEDRN